MLRVEPEIKANFVTNGQVQLAFHHVLDHGNSALLHQAVECAGDQDPLTFWHMHDLLFEHQNEMWQAGPPQIAALAHPLNLDTGVLESCLVDGQFAQKVTAMDATRREQGIRQRPSFLLNDRMIVGANPYQNFASAIDVALGQ